MGAITRSILILFIASCAGDPESLSYRRDAESADAYSNVDAPIVEDKDGVVIANLVPHPTNIRIVRGSATGGIPNARAEFQPGSFPYQTQVTMSEGFWPVASSSVLQELQLGTDVYIQAVGKPVLLTWTYDENAVVEFGLHIPGIDGVEVGKGQALVVFYKINMPDSSDFNVGLVPPSQVTAAEGVVSFNAKAYGIYQAAIVSKVIEAPKEVKSEKPLEAPKPVDKGSPPAAFEVLATNLSSKVQPAKVPVFWNPAGGASSFEVLLDNNDASCKSPERTYKDLKVLSLAVEAVNGQNYVCVFAVNANGKTPASNNGKISFEADATIPATPGGLKSSVNGINVTVSWNPVDAATFSYYELQIGTQKDGVEQFNGPIVDKTSYQFAGFGTAGTVYFARVRAVDEVGNASAWSGSIGPVAQ